MESARLLLAWSPVDGPAVAEWLAANVRVPQGARVTLVRVVAAGALGQPAAGPAGKAYAARPCSPGELPGKAGDAARALAAATGASVDAVEIGTVLRVAQARARGGARARARKGGRRRRSTSAVRLGLAARALPRLSAAVPVPAGHRRLRHRRGGGCGCGAAGRGRWGALSARAGRGCQVTSAVTPPRPAPPLTHFVGALVMGSHGARETGGNLWKARGGHLWYRWGAHLVLGQTSTSAAGAPHQPGRGRVRAVPALPGPGLRRGASRAAARPGPAPARAGAARCPLPGRLAGVTPADALGHRACVEAGRQRPGGAQANRAERPVRGVRRRRRLRAAAVEVPHRRRHGEGARAAGWPAGGCSLFSLSCRSTPWARTPTCGTPSWTCPSAGCAATCRRVEGGEWDRALSFCVIYGAHTFFFIAGWPTSGAHHPRRPRHVVPAAQRARLRGRVRFVAGFLALSRWPSACPLNCIPAPQVRGQAGRLAGVRRATGVLRGCGAVGCRTSLPGGLRRRAHKHLRRWLERQRAPDRARDGLAARERRAASGRQ